MDDHYVTMKDFGPGKSAAGNSAVLLEMGAAQKWLELVWAQRRRSRTQSGTVTWLRTLSSTVQDHQPPQLYRPHQLDEDHQVPEADEELGVGYGALRPPLPFGD